MAVCLARSPCGWALRATPLFALPLFLTTLLPPFSTGATIILAKQTTLQPRATTCACATQGAERVRMPLHLQVSSVSPEALRLVEAAGGSVTRVYYTRLGLRALLKVWARGVSGVW